MANVKVIIKNGVVESVLTDAENIDVEVVDIDDDYEDYDKLEEYKESLYKAPEYKQIDHTVARFDGEE